MMRTGSQIPASAGELRADSDTSRGIRMLTRMPSRIQTGIAVPIARVYQALLWLDAAISSHTLPFPRTIMLQTKRRLAQAPIPRPVSRVYRWLAAHMSDEVVIVLLATALSIAFYSWYASHAEISSFNDARIRTMIGRRVLVSRTPGLAQLGTTWLPLHFFSMLPFIWNDTLYRSGLAGSLPSMAAYVIASLYMYRICHLVFASRGAGWIACAIVMLNPSVLYMQSTAMSEIPLLCAMIVAVYYTLQWAHTFHTVDMLKASAAVAAATAIRYDGWVLAIALAPLVGYLAWRRQGYKAIEPWLILYSLLAFAGCVAWVIYNWVIFDDPLLAFFYGSRNHGTAFQRVAEHSESYHQLGLSFQTYGYSAGATAGWLIALLAALGLVAFALRFRLRATTLAAYSFLLPFAFYWLVFYVGINRVEVPELGEGRYYNIRFGLVMIPAIAFFAAALVIKRYRFLIVALMSVIVLFSAVNSTLQTPYVLREALSGAGSEGQVTGRQQADWFSGQYRGGNVLITYTNNSALMFYLMTEHDFPDGAFITEANGQQFKSALARPEASVTWIVMNPETKNGANLLWTSLERRHEWRQHFVLVKKFGKTEIYERVHKQRATAQPAGKSHPSLSRCTQAPWKKSRPMDPAIIGCGRARPI